VTAANTSSAVSSGASTWRWWEARRLRFNLALIVVGWLGYGIIAAATLVWSELSPRLSEVMLGQGLMYVFYMVVVNVLYLAGVLVEGVLKPEPVADYRRHAFRLGILATCALPLIVALAIAASLGLSPSAV